VKSPNGHNARSAVLSVAFTAAHTSRRSLPFWGINDSGACFIVRDPNGQAPSYVYYGNELGSRAAAPGCSSATRRGA
jgi:hypothetical protein